MSGMEKMDKAYRRISQNLDKSLADLTPEYTRKLHAYAKKQVGLIKEGNDHSNLSKAESYC